MSLCNTCRSIDLLNVPQLRGSGYGFNSQNESPVLVTMRRKRTGTEEQLSGPLGEIWHQSREELQASVKDCSICKVVEQDISRFEADLEDSRDNDYFKRRKLKGPDWRMWLARGENEVSGFMVMAADTESEVWVWVLSAIGFCVDGI
jgi:hypothetical protein